MKRNFILTITAVSFFLIFNQSTAQTTLESAQMQYNAGLFDKAESILLSDLESHSKDAAYLKLLADSKHKQDKFSEAVKLYSKAIKYDDGNALLFFSRGAALVFLAEYKEALSDLNTAIKLQPDSAEMYYYKGYCLAELFRYNAAIQAYSKAISLKPDYAAAIYNRGAAKGELDRYEEGMADFKTALDKDPELVDGQINLALSQLGMKEYETAIKGFDEVIKSRDNNLGKAYFYRGEAKYELGNKEEACNDYKKALNLGYTTADINIKNLCGSNKKSKRREIDITF
jgi:tetratricopeptide (TPR) repeat protein